MRKQIRKLRHWKQRFDRNAEFVFRRRKIWGAKTYEPGDPIPPELNDNPTKLRRFWESGTIELAEFDEPDVATGQVEYPDGVTVEKGNGSWFVVTTPDGETKVNGQGALDELIARLRAEAVEVPEDDKPRYLNGLWYKADGTEIGDETALEEFLTAQSQEENHDDPGMLLGSSVLAATYEIEGETITLGEIVGITQENSGMTVDEWNATVRDNPEHTEALLAQSLQWMQYQGEDDDWLEGGE